MFSILLDRQGTEGQAQLTIARKLETALGFAGYRYNCATVFEKLNDRVYRAILDDGDIVWVIAEKFVEDDDQCPICGDIRCYEREVGCPCCGFGLSKLTDQDPQGECPDDDPMTCFVDEDLHQRLAEAVPGGDEPADEPGPIESLHRQIHFCAQRGNVKGKSWDDLLERWKEATGCDYPEDGGAIAAERDPNTLLHCPRCDTADSFNPLGFCINCGGTPGSDGYINPNQLLFVIVKGDDMPVIKRNMEEVNRWLERHDYDERHHGNTPCENITASSSVHNGVVVVWPLHYPSF